MADPVVPNFTVGVGRLATDRFTYEKHTNGTDDRHKANQIDLFPTVVIGTPQSTVQDAIAAISTVIGTPPPDASTTVKGIVKLAGDIAGNANSVSVTKIQGKPVSSLTPTTGDVLTWDGSTWKPQSIVGTFANLTVTGNTTLGTTSGNTLVVNAQSTFAGNLNASANVNLGSTSGNTITITGVTGITGNTTITGAVGITGVTTINGNTSVTGTFGVTGNATITSGTLNVTNAISMATGATAVSYTSLLTTTLTSGDTVRVISPTSILLQAPNININGSNNLLTGSQFVVNTGVTCTIQSNLVMSGTSKINKRHADGPTSNSDIYPGLYDVYHVPAAMTGDRQWTINETLYPATQVGIEFEIVNYNANNVTVYSVSPYFTNLGTVNSGQRGTFYRKSGANGWTFSHKNYIYT